MGELLWFIVAVLVGALAWGFVKGYARKAHARPSRPRRRRQEVKDPRILFHCAVAGESFYQENIRRVAVAGKDVALVPEPDNPYDKNAVRVDADGLAIGHIPREHAREARRDSWKAIIAAVNSGSKATGIVLGIIETSRRKKWLRLRAAAGRQVNIRRPQSARWVDRPTERFRIACGAPIAAVPWRYRPRLCENSLSTESAKNRPLRTRCIRFFATWEG